MADFQRQQQQQMIDRDVALLVLRRFCAEIFIVDNINRAGFTTNQFMNHMHDLTRIKDVNILVQVLELGRNASMIRGMRVAAQSLEKILRAPYN
ncbi:hypothetical protein P8452_35157 [Trifolium repens]|nr:hypothetical protein P8452_35157 [Trifolium repens]